jgi:hypothetical protein
LDELNEKSAPSLADLKEMLVRRESYFATPQLTSDYFYKELAGMLCGNSDQKPNCKPIISEGLQFTKLKETTTKGMCDEISKMESSEIKASYEMQHAELDYNDITAFERHATYRYIKKTDPKLYKKWQTEIKAKENRIRCKMNPKNKCGNEPSADGSPVQLAIYERYLSLTSGPQFEHLLGRKTNWNHTTEDPEYYQFLQDEYVKDRKEIAEREAQARNDLFSKFATLKGQPQQKPGPEAEPDFFEEYNKASKNLDDRQKIRKNLALKNQRFLRKYMDAFLKLPENKELQERLQNIKKCEAGPINKPL